MDTLLAEIQRVAAEGNIRVSAHGFEELADDDISLSEIIDSLDAAIPVEEYPDYHKGPCILVLQRLHGGSGVHVLWGLAKNSRDVATLITAYRPDPDRWSEDFLRREPR